MFVLENVTLQDEEQPLLKDVNLIFPMRGFVAIEEEKSFRTSSLLPILAGMEEPTSGEVFFLGNDLALLDKKEREDYRNKNVCYLTDENIYLHQKTIYQNCLLALGFTRLKKEEKKDRLHAILILFDLTEHKDRTPLHLSLLERKKLSLAMAVLKDPPVLLIEDNLFLELEERDKEEIYGLLRKVAMERLVVLSVSSLKEVQPYVSHFALIHKGVVVENNMQNLAKPEVKDLRDMDSRHLSFVEQTKLAFYNMKVRPFFLLLSFFFALVSFSLFGLYMTTARFDQKDALINWMKEDTPTSLRYMVEEGGSHDDLSSFYKEYKLQATGVVRPNGILYLDHSALSPIDDASKNFYAYQSRVNFFVYVDNLESLPKGYSLLAGTLPLEDASILLTDYQYAYFLKTGFKDKVSGETISTTELSDPSVLVGHSLSNNVFQDGNSTPLKISGILSTGFKAEDYASLVGNKEETELENDFDDNVLDSYPSMGFVSGDIMNRLMASNPITYSQKVKESNKNIETNLSNDVKNVSLSSSTICYSHFILPTPSDETALTNLLENTYQNEKYVLTNTKMSKLNTTADTVSFYGVIFLRTLIVASVLTLFFLTFTLDSIFNMTRNELRLIFALGARKSDVGKNYLYMALFVVLAAFVISLPCIFGFASLLNASLVAYAISSIALFFPSVLIVFLTLLFAFGMMILSLVFPTCSIVSQIPTRRYR